jgi:DNA-binding LacI/PurR family transcriptional regulator
MPVNGKPATIRDVAALAGVSTATVSRAMRGYPGVEPATRALVEDAARRLRYRPSGVARSLKLRATQTIGLIVTDITNPYFPQIVRAVEDAAREHGYSVLLADGRNDPEREVESLEVLAHREVDGLIIASTALTTRHTDRIRELPCPVVIVNGVSTVAAVPAVLSDNMAGGRLAAGHLLELGHRRLGYVGIASGRSGVIEERVSGVRAALVSWSLDPGTLPVVWAAEGVGDGERATLEIIEHAPSTTALVCANDLSAIGAIRGLRRAGWSVPGDVSVVGFDAIELASLVDPPLTTVRQDTGAMGSWAMASLLARIHSGPEADAGSLDGGPGHTERLPVTLVVGGSTALPRASDRLLPSAS